jgi:asparagine synthase (glutamine-hydrolysing)
MCGITGYSGIGNESILERMNDTLRHRGPDDAGMETFEAGGKSLGLAQRRLSIIDLSPGGHQPMSNEDGTVWIVFNGEIYNFKDVRAGLKRAHAFKGQSDTEVIVHLYEEVGTEVFSKIEGMFAIALYDSKKDQLILARDRMGKKPLYWSKAHLNNGDSNTVGATFIFGSELKALMAHPSFKKEIDVDSLNKYFLYENVPTPHTIFKNTWKLEPGTFLVWDGNQAKKTQFWSPTFVPKALSFSDSLADLDGALQSAVSDRLVADVPLGIFLSGGLDSSTVAYYAARAHQGKVKTFSIGFKEASFDESGYARQVARHLDTEHHEQILAVHDCLDIIPTIGNLLDEPMADASIIPTYLLSQFTREHVTVALGGDGGDELFCGYDTFLAHKFAALYAKVPKVIREGFIKNIVMRLPTSHANMSLDFRLKRFVSGFEASPAYRDRDWFAPFNQTDRQALFNPDIRKEIADRNAYDDIEGYLEHADSHDMYDELGLLYERMYMMDEVLVKVDRASMMNSLEVRAPFLDTRVVDLANHMPASFKMKGLTRKYILKKLMEGKLPRDIVYRKKKGFGIPIAEWIRGGLKPVVLDFLGPGSIGQIGLFDLRFVDKLLSEHFSGKKDNRKQIWTLLIFAMWWRKWMR